MEAGRWSYDESIYDTLLELWALEEYITILAVELPRVVDNEKQRLRKGLKGADDEKMYNADIAEYQLDEGITTRLLTGTALVATWATFESSVKRAAEILRRSKHIENPLTGNGSPDKAKKYFENVLRFDLLPPSIGF